MMPFQMSFVRSESAAPSPAPSAVRGARRAAFRLGDARLWDPRAMDFLPGLLEPCRIFKLGPPPTGDRQGDADVDGLLDPGHVSSFLPGHRPDSDEHDLHGACQIRPAGKQERIRTSAPILSCEW